jgi:hypothetical protein
VYTIVGTRLELHQELVDILGSNNVYFQAPESIKLEYPCVIYNLTGINARYADDVIYNKGRRYEVIFITKDPDSELIDAFFTFPLVSFDRTYVYDNLHHFVYNIYY